MPQELGIRVGISQTFSLLQASMVLNDVQYYARGFADTARMYVPGHEPMIGRADVVTRFAEMNVQLGITDFVRISDGHRVDGRVVLDSGRFEITAAQPFPRDALPASGRYWTHWMFTESGQWIIVRDSLAHSR